MVVVADSLCGNICLFMVVAVMMYASVRGWLTYCICCDDL